MKLDRTHKGRWIEAGQQALVEHFETLDDAQQQRLLAQMEGIDLDLVADLRAGQRLATPAEGEREQLASVGPEKRRPDGEAYKRGARELREGKVGFVLLAGGQASRLRWDGPKGTFPIGPATDRSLFQILVEQARRGQRDFNERLPLAVTTSATTDAAIRALFEANDCFGFDRELLSFACQPSLPVLDDQGQLILCEPDRVFASPDGHGGAIRVLETSGIAAAWEGRGVTTVCTLQVDNPLLRIVDPDFVGRLWMGEAELATKVILKERPEQKLGVIVRVGGRPAIVEYSEISREDAERRDADGQLTYRLGSIAVHAFRLDFLRAALGNDLPLHTARKEVPCLDGRCWGVKYERFLFDLFPRARDVVVVEVEREREYEPVKNAEGEESPGTARAALDREYHRWYREAGTTAPEESPLELSPLDAMSPADLK